MIPLHVRYRDYFLFTKTSEREREKMIGTAVIAATLTPTHTVTHTYTRNSKHSSSELNLLPILQTHNINRFSEFEHSSFVIIAPHMFSRTTAGGYHSL